MLATHSYTKNPNGPEGNELDLMEGYTLVYLMKHVDNEHWWMKRKAIRPGNKDMIRGLMEPRLEGRWDRMEKAERQIQRQ